MSRPDGPRARRGLYALLGTMIVFAATPAVAEAASLTGPNGALHGCIDKSGVLHVVAYKGACKPHQKSVKFGASPDVVTSLQTKVKALQTQNAALKYSVDTLTATLHGVTRNGTTLRFSGVNLQIVSGSGATDGLVNGLGNLIIGYDGSPGSQTGSHNVVIGDGQAFTSYGGLIAGEGNTVTAPFASVTGGHFNVANASWASVAGGCDNLAGAGTTPTGPCSDQAPAVLGGASNRAAGTESTISGGQSNSATGSIATVSGGYVNVAAGLGSSVSGGYANNSGANESSITGGGENTATGDVATIAGGYYNTATNDESTILGGCSNVSGTGNVFINAGCTSFGNSFQAIVGGIGNNAVNVGAALLGGYNNTISSSSGGAEDALVGGNARTLSSITDRLSLMGATTYAG